MTVHKPKRWTDAEEPLCNSWQLARQVIDSGFAPTLLFG